MFFSKKKKSLHTPVTRRFQKVIAIFIIIIYDLHSGSSYGFIEFASEEKKKNMGFMTQVS